MTDVFSRLPGHRRVRIVWVLLSAGLLLALAAFALRGWAAG